MDIIVLKTISLILPSIGHSLKSGPETRDSKWHSLKSGPETQDLRPETWDPEIWDPEIWDPETTSLWELRQNL